MARVITIANQKGGIGKTTTAQALIEGLRKKGYKVLGIDLDTQANLTQAMHREGANLFLADLLAGKTAKAVIESDFIASDYRTTKAEKEATAQTIKQALAPISKGYDFIIIDTPPKIDTLTLSALIASGEVVITATADSFAISGMKTLLTAIESAKERNSALKLSGVLFVRFNERSVLNRQIRLGLVKTGVKVFDATIRESVAIREAQAMQEPLFEYAKDSRALQDYERFVNELIKGGK
jgi:chromosome partitioning protein